MDYVIPQIKSQSYNKLHLVLGFVKDKVAEKLLRLFPENAIFYFAAPNIPRALPIADLEKVANNLNLNFKTFPTVAQAMIKAQSMAGSDDLIYVGGSTFVVAEIL